MQRLDQKIAPSRHPGEKDPHPGERIMIEGATLCGRNFGRLLLRAAPASSPLLRPVSPWLIHASRVSRADPARPLHPPLALTRASCKKGKAVRRSHLPAGDTSAPSAAIGEDDAHQIGGVAGAKLLHDAGAMHLDGARADTERAPGFLVGSPMGDLGQHVLLARG